MTLQKEIQEAMFQLSKHPKTVFLGENVINAGRIYGTLDRVPLRKCIEMPVAENLIAGTAIGLSIEGYIPICIFQRMDFMLIAADQIINHACMLPKITDYEIRCHIIFRTIKADLNDKFYVGHQHSKDFSHVFMSYMPVRQVPERYSATNAYKNALLCRQPSLVVEEYASYQTEY